MPMTRSSVETIVRENKVGDGEGTNLTMEQLFPSKEELERIINKYGAIEGAKQHIGNLGKYLDALKKNSEEKMRV